MQGFIPALFFTGIHNTRKTLLHTRTAVQVSLLP